MVLMAGTTPGPYQILAMIGESGMGPALNLVTTRVSELEKK